MTGFDLDAIRHRLLGVPESAGLRPVGLKRAVVGEGALDRLADAAAGLLPGTARIAVISDRTAKLYRDGDLLEWVLKSLSALAATDCVLLGAADREVHADEATLADAVERCRGAGLVVAVGSGTMADIGKVVAADLGLGYLVVQSAASVNGFADDRSVLLRNGVKRTVPSRWADVLVADSDVLVAAPPLMNASGLADLIAMFSAPADWYLANLLGMDDFYSPSVVATAREPGPELLRDAARLQRRDAAALSSLAGALTLSGIAMGVAGTTAPCSGMEHAVSHLLEMSAVRAGAETALHGVQVGVGSLVASVLWRRVLEELAEGGLARRVSVPAPDALESRVRAAFAPVGDTGEMAEECWRDCERKLARWARAGEAVARAGQDWPVHDRALRALLGQPKEIAAALRAAGAPVSFAELGPEFDDEHVFWAVANCNLMRERFSVADLARFMGLWDEQFVGSLLAEAASLAALS